MAPEAAATSMFDTAALQRREAPAGASGPGALVKNAKVFRITLFACIGGCGLFLLCFVPFVSSYGSISDLLFSRTDSAMATIRYGRPPRRFAGSPLLNSVQNTYVVFRMSFLAS